MKGACATLYKKNKSAKAPPAALLFFFMFLFRYYVEAELFKVLTTAVLKKRKPR